MPSARNEAPQGVETSLPMAPRNAAADRRRGARVPIRAPATLLYGVGLQEQLDCIIEDRSADGAMLTVDRAAALPSEMLLVDRLSRRCTLVRIAWRTGESCGVSLRAMLDVNDDRLPEMAAVRALLGEPAPSPRKVVALDC